MKRGTPRNPKTKAFARTLKIPIYSAVGILEMLWHFTAEFCVEGDIGKLSDEEIADAVGWEGDSSDLIGALVSCRWLDDFQNFPEFSGTRHRLMVHDWRQHCDDYTKKKLKDIPIFQNIPENSGKFCPTLPCLTLPKPNQTLPAPSETSPRSTLPNGTLGTGVFDDGFDKFRTAYTAAGYAGIEIDWQTAKFPWVKLDWEQKLARVQAAEMLSGHDPEFMCKPRKFLEAEWERKPRPAKELFKPKRAVDII